MDLKPGGRWQYVMHGPDGAEYPATGVFREIAPLKRITTSDEFDAGFKHPTVTDLPRGMVVTADFEDVGDRTRPTPRTAHPTVEDRRKHEGMGVGVH